MCVCGGGGTDVLIQSCDAAAAAALASAHETEGVRRVCRWHALLLRCREGGRAASGAQLPLGGPFCVPGKALDAGRGLQESESARQAATCGGERARARVRTGTRGFRGARASWKAHREIATIQMPMQSVHRRHIIFAVKPGVLGTPDDSGDPCAKPIKSTACGWRPGRGPYCWRWPPQPGTPDRKSVV